MQKDFDPFELYQGKLISGCIPDNCHKESGKRAKKLIQEGLKISPQPKERNPRPVEDTPPPFVGTYLGLDTSCICDILFESKPADILLGKPAEKITERPVRSYSTSCKESPLISKPKAEEEPAKPKEYFSGFFGMSFEEFAQIFVPVLIASIPGIPSDTLHNVIDDMYERSQRPFVFL